MSQTTKNHKHVHGWCGNVTKMTTSYLAVCLSTYFFQQRLMGHRLLATQQLESLSADDFI